MPTLNGNREQMVLMPSCIEDYVGPDDRVRAYDAFIEQLLQQGEIHFPSSAYEGRPEYSPIALLKLLVYSYSYGVRSSRQIERACFHNLSFIWLTGGLKPDHKTIARFRREHLDLLKGLLKKCVKLCIQLNLIDGHILFIDGTKIRANASHKKTWRKEKCEKVLAQLDERIEELLKECETLDQTEQAQSGHVKMQSELCKSETLRQKVQEALEKLKEQGKERINVTDPDSAPMKSAQGKHVSYNVQNAADDKHSLIVSSEVVSDATDVGQLAIQAQNAQDNIGHPCQSVCADAGYANTTELQKVEQTQVQPIVPSQTQALHQQRREFHHDDFKYDAQKDCYVCLEGKTLICVGSEKPGISKAYRITSASVCQACPHFGVCTSSPQGRKITRLLNADAKERFEAIYASPQGQAIYKKRKEKIEHPFGYLKRILKVDSFLLRGRSGAQAEASIFSTCFNLTRMIHLLGGVPQLIAQWSP